jgi:hypothetical protein
LKAGMFSLRNVEQPDQRDGGEGTSLVCVVTSAKMPTVRTRLS